jgi:CubicO group peptidase (beta-lactamase class C family)
MNIRSAFFLFLLFCLNPVLARQKNTVAPTNAKATKTLDSVFNVLHQQGSFNGCVLIAENGKETYKRAFGYANFETKDTLNNKSVFELASVSKQFTAMAIMQLHQKEKLAYTDDIRKYLPSLTYSGITIDHLLHHTSGIPEFLQWNEKQIDVTRVNYNQDILNTLVAKNITPLFKAGEYMAYSNTNYVLLALIVEKISGTSFASYMEKFIFKPLQMSNTYIQPQRSVAKKISNYAYGHIYSPKDAGFVLSDRQEANKYQYYFDGSAGAYGIGSTTEDLLKWDQALYTEKLLSKAEQQLAYTPAKLLNGKNATFHGIPYGFGWLVLPTKAYTGKRYSHTGGYPGHQTIITRYPEKNKAIILLTNQYNVLDIGMLSFAIENILFDRPFKLPQFKPFKKIVPVSPADLKAIEGIYSLAPGVKFTITTDQNQVYAQLTGQVNAEIYPESELEFFYTVVEAKLEFVRNAKGKIDKLILHQNGRQQVAMKDI